MTENKYNAKRTAVGNLVFDSKLEAATYTALKTCVFIDNDLNLKVKPGLVIKPSTERIKERKWLCDFRLQHPTKGFLHIESKGYLDPSFKFYLEMLDINFPEVYERVVIVLDKHNKEVVKFAKTYKLRAYSTNDINSLIFSDSWD